MWGTVCTMRNCHLLMPRYPHWETLLYFTEMAEAHRYIKIEFPTSWSLTHLYEEFQRLNYYGCYATLLHSTGDK